MPTHRSRGSSLLIGGLAIGAILGTAHAAEPVQWYAGLSHANAHVEVWRGFGWEQAGVRDSLAVRGGVRLRKHLALELGLLSADDLEWHEYYAPISGLPHTYDAVATFDTSSQRLSVLGILPFGRIWEGFVGGGLVRYRVSGSLALRDAWNDAQLAPRSISRRGHDSSFGFGVSASVKQAWRIRVEFQTFGLATDFLAVPEGDWPTLDTFEVGVDYRFHRRVR
jgi:hypothetical protein